MPNIKPISDLRNYASVLREVSIGEPVYLTKNGRGAYAIVDISDQEEYEKLKAHAWLMSEVSKGVRSYEEKGSVSAEEIIKYFEEKHKDD